MAAKKTGKSQSSMAFRITLYAVACVAVILLASVGLKKLKPSMAGDSADHLMHTVDYTDFDVTITEKGELKAINSVDVRSMVEGRSTIIQLIPEGTEVKKGDVLVKLAADQITEKIKAEEVSLANAESRLATAETDYDIQIDQNASDIRKAELTLETAEVDLEKYINADWPQKLQDAKLALESAEDRLRRAKDDLEQSQNLLKKEFVTQKEVEDDAFQVRVEEKAVLKAQLALESLNKYTYPQELKQKQSDVEEAKKELERTRKSASAKDAQKKADLDARRSELEIIRERLAKYRDQADKTVIEAPAPGLVVYFTQRWHDTTLQEGAEVYEHQVLITLPDTSRMKAELRIHEALASQVKLGQKATLTVEGQQDKVFTGEVTKIASVADTQNRWLNPDLKQYTTEVTLDPVGEIDLKPGTTVQAKIHIDRVRNKLAVPVQSVFARGRSHYVFRQNGNGIEPVDVEIGMASNEYIEIHEGLNPGDEVLLSINDDMMRLLPDNSRSGNGRSRPGDRKGGDSPKGKPQSAGTDATDDTLAKVE